MARRNLCPNPAAKNNATGFSGSASPSRVTGLTGFPRSTGVTAGGTGFIQSPTAACAPGDQLVVSLHASAATVLGAKTVYAAFTRSAGGDDFSQTFSITVDTTVHRASATVTAPANATGVYLLLDGITTGVNASGFMYELGTVDGGYADGDTASWQWDGADGSSSSTEVTGTNIPVSGTLLATAGATGTVSTSRPVAGTLRATAHASGLGAGGDEVATSGASYDLNEIFDALADTFDGTPTGDTIGGVPVQLECYSEVVGQVEPPAIVLDMDGQGWDLNMGSGADSISVIALLLVTFEDSEGAQRTLRSFLSRKDTSGLFRIKRALLANQSLGGLVSYAIITNTRSVGIITYNGVDYLGAELVIEVMS